MAPTGNVSLSFSSVGVGTACFSPTSYLKGGTFTVDFMYAATAGFTELDFAFDGYGYRGSHSDHRDFAVNAAVTFQEQGKQAPTVLDIRSLVSL